MSLHPSLRKAGKSRTVKTVLKRNERIQWLKERERWDGSSRVYGLPKIKIVKLKTVKKEKAAEEKKEGVGAAAPTAPSAAATAGAPADKKEKATRT